MLMCLSLSVCVCCVVTLCQIHCRLFEGVISGAEVCKWLVQSKFHYARDSSEAAAIGDELVRCGLLIPVCLGFIGDHDDGDDDDEHGYHDEDDEDERDRDRDGHAGAGDADIGDEGRRSEDSRRSRVVSEEVITSSSASNNNEAYSPSAKAPASASRSGGSGSGSGGSKESAEAVHAAAAGAAGAAGTKSKGKSKSSIMSALMVSFNVSAGFLYRYPVKSTTGMGIGSFTLFGALVTLEIPQFAQREGKDEGDAGAGAGGGGGITLRESLVALHHHHSQQPDRLEKNMEQSLGGRGRIHYEVVVSHGGDDWAVWRRRVNLI